METMEMLHEIAAADRAARERYEAARRERDGFDGRLGELALKAQEEAMRRARQDVEAERQRAHAASEEALGALDREFEAEQAALKERFAAHKDAGVEEMLRMVVGQDD